MIELLAENKTTIRSRPQQSPNKLNVRQMYNTVHPINSSMLVYLVIQIHNLNVDLPLDYCIQCT